MKIRKAQDSDSKAISKLIIETLEKVNGKDYDDEQISVWKKRNTPERIKEKIGDKNRYECLAVVDKNIVGYGSLNGKVLMSLYTRATMVGRGIGSAVFKALEAEQRKREVKISKITSTLTAANFYQKQGYKKISDSKEEMDGVKIPCVLMEKAIA